MKTALGHASGKLILLGEHAVVYGQPALGLGFGSLRAVFAPSHENGLRLFAPCWELRADADDPGPLGAALFFLSSRFNHPNGELQIDTALPLAAGLGSSAALSVACVRALLAASGLAETEEAQRALAHELERRFHGTPSGLDDTLATYGGLCLFGAEAVEAEALALNAAPLHARAWRLPAPRPPLVVGLSGTRHQTRELVAAVRARREHDPQGEDARFARIGRLCVRGAKAALAADWPALGAAMNDNQRELDEMGVGSEALTALVDLARRAGAYGAKLSGAGGGGAVVALADAATRDKVVAAWREAGFAALQESEEQLS